ncbi:MAG: hypothetical protein Kapaf2KO_21550 [Candidatus Kapaibacteriales bacterium]
MISLIILTALPSFAQLQGQELIDSLEAELPKANGDTNEVKLLNELSKVNRIINPQVGVKYGKKAFSLSDDLDWEKGIVKSYSSQAINYISLLDFQKALDLLNEALELSEELEYKSETARILGNIGVIHSYRSEHSKALEYYLKSLVITEEIGNLKNLSSSLSNIGVVYQNLEDTENALKYYRRALEIQEKLSDKDGVSISLINIGSIYNDELRLDSALIYYQRALEVGQKTNSLSIVTRSYNNLGSVYANLKDYDRAIEAYNNSLEISKELQNQRDIAFTIGNLGHLYFTLSQDSLTYYNDELNDYSSISHKLYLNNSIEYLEESILKLEEQGELGKRSSLLKILAKAYKSIGDPDKAYETLELHQLLKDSVFTAEKAREINTLLSSRDRVEEERKNEKQAQIDRENRIKRDRLQYLGIGAIVVFFGILLLLSGRMKLSEWVARALVFLTFIFLFEFILVIIDPWTDEYSEGIPIIKFAINMCLALIIFPMHQYFERRVSLKVVKPDSMSNEQILEEFRRRKDEEKI